MFIDEFFGEKFYKELGVGYHSLFAFGQFFWTHAYYPHENLELWRPILDPNERTKTVATAFRITPAGVDAFRRDIPLQSPKLETNEEFLVIRAKRRPVVLVRPESPWFGVDQSGYRGKVQRHLCTAAQVYGIADPRTGKAQFSEPFVNRVKKLEFPELMFLPKEAGLLDVDSFLRLDELQSVFTPHLEASPYALGDEVIKVLRGQIKYLFTKEIEGDYTVLSGLLRGPE